MMNTDRSHADQREPWAVTTIAEDWSETEPRLKRNINELLWEALPPTTTIGEAEVIACRIYGELTELWNRAIDGKRAP